MAESINKKKKNLSTLKKVLIIIAASFVALILIAFIILDQRKDDLIPIIIDRINENIDGEISYNKTSASPFKHFPNVSIIIENPSLRSGKSSESDTLISFKSIDLSFDLIDLIQSKVNLRQLTISDGFFRMEQEADSSFSLINSLVNFESIPDTVYEEHNVQIAIEKIALTNIEILYTQLSPQIRSHSFINDLNARLSIQNEIISSELNLSGYINELTINNLALVKEMESHIESDLTYDITKAKLSLQNTQALFEEALISVNGSVDFKESKEIDIDFEADDKDLRFTKLFFSNRRDKEIIKSGNLYLNGSINGSYLDGFPLTKISFGSNDLNIKIPKSDNSIEGLNFTGTFDSGEKINFQSAKISIKDIDAKLPDGYLKGNFSLTNFQNPYIDYFIDLESNLEGFNEIFSNSSIDSLSGFVKIDNSFRGFVKVNTINPKDSLDKINIKLKDMAIKLSDDFKLKNLNGFIKGQGGSIKIDSLKANLNGSDIRLHGEIDHYLGFLFNLDDTSQAHLFAQTEMYDFPRFFAYDENVAKAFPYKIKDVELEVIINSSLAELTEFNSTPHIEFQFNKLKGEVLDFCPPIEMSNGEFILGESGEVIQLDFNDFEMTVGGKEVDVDFFYSFSGNTNDSIVIDANLNKVDLVESLYLEFLSSFRDSSKIILDGNFESTLVWKTDSISIIKNLIIENEGLAYFKDSTILSYSHCHYDARNITKIFEDDKNAFSTVNGILEINVKDLYSTLISEANLNLEIRADSGEFDIHAYDHNISQEAVKFNVTCRPFDSMPSYRVRYNLNDQSVEDLLASYYSDSLLLGKINLDLDLSFKGRNSKELLSSLNGNMLLQGDSLKIMGFDMDNMIKKFKRSQSFNLVDVGAVVVAGPVGILYSKGSDYAIMIAGDKGDSSLVTQFKSQWDVEEGRLSIQDLAFATEINRMAARGWIDMKVDSLDLTIAVIDENGCNIISQDLYGDIKEPTESKVKVVKTVIAPVTNLVTDVLAIDCDVFYEGSVEHPAGKKKKESSEEQIEE